MSKDLEKRKRVMGRSMQLGHCICNPKEPCPCAVFREQDVCPCAGERLPVPQEAVCLTRLVDSPGCASKIDAATLKRVLRGLPTLEDPRVLVGVAAGDDAGVFQLDEHLALVQTVDVFSPSVDDPYTFGQIAAANSLSDVYAMGGRAITALSIIGFPIRSMPETAMHEILRGGVDKMKEAGVPVIGGHSIHDSQVKAGFAVTGLVDPQKMITNARARPGDALVLTKPLGTGMLLFASQIGRAPPGSLEAAARSMAALNRQASELMLDFGAEACTDVTGFGLFGHLGAMAAASQVDVEVVWDDLPLLPGVCDCAAQGIFSGAVERNRDSSAACVVAGEQVDAAMLDVGFDPQTSGGLLISLPHATASALLARLHEHGLPEAAIIGRVLGPGSGQIEVRTTRRRPLPAAQRPAIAQASRSALTTSGACCSGSAIEEEVKEAKMKSCCGEAGGSAVAVTGGAADTQAKFLDFVKTAGAPRFLDARTKQAIAIALAVLAKCEPCVKIHIKKAKDMGFSQEEIDEAAWMAISFGGAPTMMFYQAAKK